MKQYYILISENKVWAIQGLLQGISSQLEGSKDIVDGNYFEVSMLVFVENVNSKNKKRLLLRRYVGTRPLALQVSTEYSGVLQYRVGVLSTPEYHCAYDK
jgi:hypothetical protein